ncbi:hypothetical protein Tco_0501745 [Tanacetum coccineum]
MIWSRTASTLPLPAPSPPLLLPSTTHRDDLLEVAESPSAAAARQTRHTLAHRVDYGFIVTMDASICTSESRVMTAVEEHEATDARRAWAHSESRSLAIEAQIRALQRDVNVLQRQRIRDEDRLTSHIQNEHDMFRELVRTTEVGSQDGPADVGSSC